MKEKLSKYVAAVERWKKAAAVWHKIRWEFSCHEKYAAACELEDAEQALMHICQDEVAAALTAVPFLSLIPLYGRRAFSCLARLWRRS